MTVSGEQRRGLSHTYTCTQFSSVQFSHSVVSNSLQPHGLQASLSITNSWSLLKLMSMESVMPSNHLILPPSTFPSIRVFSNESVLHIRWPKYWSFSFSISPSNEHSGLISFRMDWLDLFAYLMMYFAYNDQFMMYSGYMYPFSLKFPSTQAAALTLNIVPCAIQEVLVGYPF